MKKIKLFPAPHVEVRIHLSDEMENDLQECRRMSVLPGDGKDCDQCSWDRVRWQGTGFCELPVVIEKVLAKQKDKECFTPEPDNPYPLCVGQGKPECGGCCWYMHYEDKPGCGPHDGADE